MLSLRLGRQRGPRGRRRLTLLLTWLECLLAAPRWVCSLSLLGVCVGPAWLARGSGVERRSGLALLPLHDLARYLTLGLALGGVAGWRRLGCGLRGGWATGCW